MKNWTIIFVLLFSIQLSAQLDRSKKPEAGPAPVFKLGEYESFQLENGLKVFVVENHKMPSVSFSLSLDRDPIVEGENAGYISMAGQLLRRGTTTRTKSQIDEEVDFIGASLSTSSTGISASSLTKHKEKIVELMADVLLNSKFDQEELDKIKVQTLSGLAQAKDDPNSIASNVFGILMYGKDHPYGEIATEETVESITLEMCEKYYKTYFRPNISYMAIVGDINKSEAEKMVKKYFGKWEKKDVPKFTYEKPTAPAKNNFAIVNRDASVQSVINIGYPIDLKIGSPDALKANIMNIILGGSFTSRLNANLREDKGYTYGAGSSISSDDLVGSFTASTTVRNNVTDSTVTEILYEIKKMIGEKVTSDELQATKNYVTGSFARSLESPGTIARFALNIAKYNLPKDYYKTYLQRLNAITVDEIQEMAKKYLKPENAHILIVSNAEEVKPGLVKLSPTKKINYFDIYGNSIDPNAKVAPKDLTPQKVIQNYINAIGGREVLEKVKTKIMKIDGKSGPLEMQVTIKQKSPNKFAQILKSEMFNQTTLFNGTSGTLTQMGQEFQLEGKELEGTKYQALLNPFLDYEKHNIKLNLNGIETIDKIDYYKIVLNLPSGEKWIHYYDIKTGLLKRFTTTVNTPQGSFVQNIDYDNYKEVDGIKFPFSSIQSTGSREVIMTVKSIEINKEISDSEFE